MIIFRALLIVIGPRHILFLERTFLSMFTNCNTLPQCLMLTCGCTYSGARYVECFATSLCSVNFKKIGESYYILPTKNSQIKAYYREISDIDFLETLALVQGHHSYFIAMH